ncbi:MAG: cytochrome C oxidase subunit II, partial [Paraburkholderia nemoris]
MSTDSNHQPGGGHAVALRAERRWAIFAVALIVLML